MIAWEGFTPVSAFVGGCLIGAAALLLMLLNGRIMGISGIIGGLIDGVNNGVNKRNNSRISGDWGWRLAFLFGAVLGPIALQILPKSDIIKSAIIWQAVASGYQLYLGAFLVGLGTVIGSGCTSGHGICGLARLSPRALVAVMAFMSSAIATVALIALV
tara:strand:- start:25 stop:501 length:477 start_codon:yes stop_codon:yes gene_type:complete